MTGQMAINPENKAPQPLPPQSTLLKKVILGVGTLTVAWSLAPYINNLAHDLYLGYSVTVNTHIDPAVNFAIEALKSKILNPNKGLLELPEVYLDRTATSSYSNTVSTLMAISANATELAAYRAIHPNEFDLSCTIAPMADCSPLGQAQTLAANAGILLFDRIKTTALSIFMQYPFTSSAAIVAAGTIYYFTRKPQPVQVHVQQVQVQQPVQENREPARVEPKRGRTRSPAPHAKPKQTASFKRTTRSASRKRIGPN